MWIINTPNSAMCWDNELVLLPRDPSRNSLFIQPGELHQTMGAFYDDLKKCLFLLQKSNFTKLLIKCSQIYIEFQQMLTASELHFHTRAEYVDDVYKYFAL